MADHENNETSDDETALILEETGSAEFDGIELGDRPVPSWFKWFFLAIIPFAIPYFMYFHGGAEGRAHGDYHDAELGALMRARFAEMDRETVVEYLYKDSWLQVGKIVFKKNCASCHGKDGGGLIGPNLCDDQYKNVNNIEDILKVLQNGANAGAMPAWRDRLLPNELVLVSSYVASLRGSTPGVAKAAEGREIAPWPAAPNPAVSVPEGAESADTEPAQN
jgi:cytochrome c oxidase cbb3-type subunit 3